MGHLHTQHCVSHRTARSVTIRPRTCHMEPLVSEEKWKLKQPGTNSQGIGTGGCWQIGNKMPFSLSLKTLLFGKKRNLKNVQ